nr:hypothetical protein [Tanacetum cinerariifolium]
DIIISAGMPLLHVGITRILSGYSTVRDYLSRLFLIPHIRDEFILLLVEPHDQVVVHGHSSPFGIMTTFCIVCFFGPSKSV